MLTFTRSVKKVAKNGTRNGTAMLALSETPEFSKSESILKNIVGAINVLEAGGKVGAGAHTKTRSTLQCSEG